MTKKKYKNKPQIFFIILRALQLLQLLLLLLLLLLQNKVKKKKYHLLDHEKANERTIKKDLEVTLTNNINYL